MRDDNLSNQFTLPTGMKLPLMQNLPPEFGQTPVPEGHVRMQHYTRPDNLPAIRQEGILQGHGQGHTYGEPDQVWATATDHQTDKEMHVAEISADPATDLDIGGYFGQGGSKQDYIKHIEARQTSVTMRGDVPPSRILATHEPWQDHARYMLNDPDTLAAVRSGQHDSLLSDTHEAGGWAPAVRYAKGLA